MPGRGSSDSLLRLGDVPWVIFVLGDGPDRGGVNKAFLAFLLLSSPVAPVDDKFSNLVAMYHWTKRPMKKTAPDTQVRERQVLM